MWDRNLTFCCLSCWMCWSACQVKTVCLVDALYMQISEFSKICLSLSVHWTFNPLSTNQHNYHKSTQIHLFPTECYENVSKSLSQIVKSMKDTRDKETCKILCGSKVKSFVQNIKLVLYIKENINFLSLYFTLLVALYSLFASL